jgi:RHS repeat-associated protein
MELDNEVKGEGNEYDYGYRRYDPRLGRWNTCDPLRAKYPGMSPYNYAGNSPISCKDPNGQYIIFVNGYVYGSGFESPTSVGGIGGGMIIPSQRGYWYEDYSKAPKNEDGTIKDSPYISAAKDHFNDQNVHFVNGTGFGISSTAEDRRKQGKEYAKIMYAQLATELAYMGDDEKIEIITHSMGAAFAEGMIEELMNYPDIAKRIKTVVHFSACDGDNIKIAKGSEFIDRYQINIKGDIVLGKWADAFSKCGYQINGVKNENYFEIKDNSIESWHNKYYKYQKSLGNTPEWDFHFDTKTNPRVFDYLKEIDKNSYEKPINDNWDHKDGSDGPQVSKNQG